MADQYTELKFQEILNRLINLENKINKIASRTEDVPIIKEEVRSLKRMIKN